MNTMPWPGSYVLSLKDHCKFQRRKNCITRQWIYHRKNSSSIPMHTHQEIDCISFLCKRALDGRLCLQCHLYWYLLFRNHTRKSKFSSHISALLSVPSQGICGYADAAWPLVPTQSGLFICWALQTALVCWCSNENAWCLSFLFGRIFERKSVLPSDETKCAAMVANATRYIQLWDGYYCRGCHNSLRRYWKK